MSRSGSSPRNHARTRITLTVATVAFVVAAAWQRSTADIIVHVELAGSAARAAEVVGTRLDEVRTSIAWDFAFIAGYAALLLVLLALRPGNESAPRRQLRGVAIAAVLLAAVADVVENLLLLHGLDPARPSSGWEVRPFEVAAVAAGLKFALLAFVLGLLVYLGGSRLLKRLFPQPDFPPSSRPARPPPPPEEDEDRTSPAGAGRAPSSWDPSPGRIGVSCSGGGVRSASFCLGALQELARGLDADVWEAAGRWTRTGRSAS